MPRFYGVLVVLSLSAAWLWVGSPASSQTTPPKTAASSLPGAGLVGTVKSPDGKPLEGVPVSARGHDKTFTTTVYTNQNGQYNFPPLADGPYRMWSQAVGFERVEAQQEVAAGKKIEQDFTLKPYTEDLFSQLSSVELFNSLPDATAEDIRMKKVLLNNCATCHSSGYGIQPRFDKAGWSLVVDYCTALTGRQDPPSKPMLQLMTFYRDDIIAYLTRVRGPQPFQLKYKPLPRPTGKATQIVVTEYDLPSDTERASLGKLDPRTGRVTLFTVTPDGKTVHEDFDSPYSNTDIRSGHVWATGHRSEEQEVGAHDATMATDGNIYFDGLGTVADKQGYVWAGGRDLLGFDVKTQQFKVYPKPKGWPTFNNGKGRDSKGNVWASEPTGLHRINLATGEYTEFKSVTEMGRPYDMTIDAEDNVWFAQIAVDKVGYYDARTGKLGEVNMLALDEPISEKDREIGKRAGSGWTTAAPLYQKGPRRMDADRNGDTVWVAQYWASQLAKINIHTKKVTDYKLPDGYRYAFLYDTDVDKNHMVWFSMANADRIGRFNPSTEEFTIYELPTRGTNVRNIGVDNSTNPPRLVVPYIAANKIAVVQPRAITAR